METQEGAGLGITTSHTAQDGQAADSGFEERVNNSIDDEDLPDRLAVEGATVVCTQMYEPESESKMEKTDTSNAEVLQGAYKLVHTDIEFYPLFEKCRYCEDDPIFGEGEEDCEPEIEDEEWDNFYGGRESNSGFGILEEESFMVCKKGYGMLYISEDGQRPCDMKRLIAMLAIKFGNRTLLGKMMCAAFGGDPVNMATGNFVFAKTDLEIMGRVPIKFQRFYNTFDKEVSSLGKGWKHSYDIRLKETKEGITITFEDGHDEVYQLGEGKDKEEKSAELTPKNEEEKSTTPKGYSFDLNLKEKKEEQHPLQKTQKNKEPQVESKSYRLSKCGETLPNADDKRYDAPDGNFSDLMRIKDTYRLVRSDGTTLYFNKNGNLIKIADQNQVETTLSYKEGKLVQVVGLSGKLFFTYTGDKITTVTDHTGRMISYTYEGDLLTSSTDPLGNVHTYSYDDKGRFLREINPEGNLIVENTYDDKDRTIKQRFADDSEMSYVYEDKEVQNIKEIIKTEFIAQNGAKTNYYRDIQYRTVEVEYPDNGIIQTEYNWKNQKISETDNIGPRTHYSYSSKGKLSRIENPLGEMTDLTYDENDRLESVVNNGVVKLRTEYNKFGNITTVENALKRQIRFSYDKETRSLPTHIVLPDGSILKVKFDKNRNVIEATNAFDVTIYHEYDSLNRVIKTIDGNGNSTQFSYDDNNNLTRITNAEGNSRTYTYNRASKVTSMSDFDGSNTSIIYDKLNNPAEIADPLGRVTKFSHDRMRNVNQIIQANGAETNLAYDKNNRLVEIEKPDGNSIKYEYDKNGNKTKIINEAGSDTFLSYDKLQRLIEIKNDEGIQFAYTYNSDGLITSVTDAMDNVKQFMYNEGGELTCEINELGDKRTYTYTQLGKVKTITDEVGGITTFEYELSGRIKSIHHPNKTTEYFTYDRNNNVKTHTDQFGLMRTYIYDCLNQVVEIISANGGRRKYTYDQIGNVVSMTNELNHTTNYTYTPTGQLEKAIDPLRNETHYSYDLLDQCTTRFSISA